MPITVEDVRCPVCRKLFDLDDFDPTAPEGEQDINCPDCHAILIVEAYDAARNKLVVVEGEEEGEDEGIVPETEDEEDDEEDDGELII